MDFIIPEWPVNKAIQALVSTRKGGLSLPPFDSLNLGDHVGDAIDHVLANRALLEQCLPNKPLWLHQTHSTMVSTSKSRLQSNGVAIEADAAVTNIPEEVLIVMTADCLPVLFTNSSGTAVGVAHAGWRGLCAGILENTVSNFLEISGDTSANSLMAWMGPAIGPDSFEVSDDVVQAFEASQLLIPKNAFRPHTNKSGKYFADIYLIARARLQACGVNSVFGGGFCTVKEFERFFSYRRDGKTGRFASAIWIAK